MVEMGGFFKDVLDGKVRDVRKWVEKGQKVGLYDEYGNTALHLASERGYRGVCKVLIDAGADVNQKNDSVGWTAVHYAAYEGHSDVLRMLIAHGAKPDALDNSGDTAESYAKEWENTECLTIIQEAVAVREARSKQTRAATKSSSDDMFDSDKTLSDESEEEDEDESSMMNWVIPPPSLPSTNIIVNQTNLVNNLVNNQFSKAVDNLTIDTEVENLHDNTKQVKVKELSDNTSFMSSKTEEYLDNENEQRNEIEQMRQSQDLELPDFVVSADHVEHSEDIDDKSSSLTCVSNFDDEDTESEDTLRLIKKTADIIVTRESTPSKLRTSSIVDRIKSSLSPAPTPAVERKKKECVDENGQPDIDKFLDLSLGDSEYRHTSRKMQQIQEEKSLEQICIESSAEKPTEKNGAKVKPVDLCQQLTDKTKREKSMTRARSHSREQAHCKEVGSLLHNDVQHRRERSVARALSQAKEIIARERSATRATSQVKDTNILRGPSQVREMTIPRELMPLADHIFSMSSATIPDDMTMSCGSIFERFGDLEGGESEKELLLKRLKELIDVEGNQIKEDLEARRKQLNDVDETHRGNVEKVTANHKREEEEMIKRHSHERESMDSRHSAEEERIQREIVKLEEELESIIAPSQLLSSLTSIQSSSSVTKVAPVKPELTELEQELECCGCGVVCRPPTKIYQCPEGDLICEGCKGGAGARLDTCPACKVDLAGMVSRNKVLENIAKKYFIAK